MMHEKSKEEYYREAAQFLNTGERASAEAGDAVGSTLSFLTRGMWEMIRFYGGFKTLLQVFNN